MDLNDRIKRREAIKKIMIRKMDLIQKYENDLRKLETELEIISESLLPILLFSMDMDGEYHYIYYFPDLNIIKNIRENEERLLHNTVDLRKNFEVLEISEANIQRISLTCRKVIKDILDNNEIESWMELGKYIKNNMLEISVKILFEIDDNSKIIRKKK